MTSCRFFFPTHSARTPPDALHRLTWLLALHRLIMVVSPLRKSSCSLRSCTSTRSVSPRSPCGTAVVSNAGNPLVSHFAGGVLGVSAALLWSAQGSIMMSYPLEKDKGKAFAVFWAIFQFWLPHRLAYRPWDQHSLRQAWRRVDRDVFGIYSLPVYFLLGCPHSPTRHSWSLCSLARHQQYLFYLLAR